MPDRTSQQGHETVLVAEDEAVVRDMVVAALERMGYRVVAASTGEEAVRLIDRMGEEIDLLLTDVVMPGMSGPDLYDRARHPYTVAMLSAVPVPDTKRRKARERIRLEGDVPSPINPPPACRFHTRCWKAQDICRTEEPMLLQIGTERGSEHKVACHFPEEPKPAAELGVQDSPVSR